MLAQRLRLWSDITGSREQEGRFTGRVKRALVVGQDNRSGMCGPRVNAQQRLCGAIPDLNRRRVDAHHNLAADRCWPCCVKASVDTYIRVQVRANEVSLRLKTIPGIGVITASALTATIGDIKAFKSGRHLAAWIGLVPIRIGR
jgi:transposase